MNSQEIKQLKIAILKSREEALKSKENSIKFLQKRKKKVTVFFFFLCFSEAELYITTTY